MSHGSFSFHIVSCICFRSTQLRSQMEGSGEKACPSPMPRRPLCSTDLCALTLPGQESQRRRLQLPTRFPANIIQMVINRFFSMVRKVGCSNEQHVRKYWRASRPHRKRQKKQFLMQTIFISPAMENLTAKM